jgi:hypothetical protein
MYLPGFSKASESHLKGILAFQMAFRCLSDTEQKGGREEIERLKA